MESNKKKCKICGEEKNRVCIGKYPNGRDKKWAQEDSKLWNGRVCGDCNVKESFKKMRRIRGQEVN